MKLALMGLGGLLIVFGLVDLLGSFAGFDLWGTLGVQLPELLWKYSSYIELVAGFMLFKAANAMAEPEVAAESEA